MADIESQIVNFYESTLAGILTGSSPANTSVATAPTTNGTSVITASASSPVYLVVDPDNLGNREVIKVTTSSGTTFSAVTRDVEGRHASGLPTHQIGTTVRLAVLAEHFADINDRMDTAATASSTTVFTNKSINGTNNPLTNLPASQVLINGATDGTAITVDTDADRLLVYDSDATAVKKIKPSQIATPVKLTNSRIFFASNG